MFATCLFCKKPLGANEVIETFPVGRRLAFDEAKGRLWVVCRGCERWNLTPLDLRWEAVEECERRFRETRIRMSTDQIGLARLSEGLELIRIGKPMRPEFAAWRYGDQFGRRRKRAIIYGVAGGAALAAIAGGAIAAGISMTVFYQIPQLLINARTVAKVRTPDGRTLKVRGSHLPGIRLFDNPGGEWPWSLRVAHTRGKTLFEGDDAKRIAAQIVPAVNRNGASAKRVQEAVQALESAGGPEGLLVKPPTWLAGRFDLKGKPARLDKIALPTRLALEMALHEEQERRALEGELALLEEAWREAEEIAAIADNMFVPPETQAALERLKAEAGREKSASV